MLAHTPQAYKDGWMDHKDADNLLEVGVLWVYPTKQHFIFPF